MRQKRTRPSFNPFRFYGVLQERVYFERNSNKIEDYRTIGSYWCDIKGLSSHQKAFDHSLEISSTHKIVARYFEEKVEANYRFVFPYEEEVFRIEAVLDKTARKEYLEFKVQKNVYTTRSTTQPTEPLIFAKKSLTEASFQTDTEESQLTEIANDIATYEELLDTDGFILDNYSFDRDLEFVASASEPQFLYIFLSKSQSESLKNEGRLLVPPETQGKVMAQEFSSLFMNNDYTCFKVNSQAFTNYLTESF